MRASRLLSILLLLQTRGRLTASQLAGILEVSVRTIYRDVESLHAAGVPLYGDAGPDGGYQLLGGYRTRLTGLTPDEAEALFLAGMPGQAAELRPRHRAGRSAAQAAGGAAGRAARAIGPDPGAVPPGRARVVSRRRRGAASRGGRGCVWRQRRIEVRYRRWAAPTDVTRILEPHGVVLKRQVVPRGQERWRRLPLLPGKPDSRPDRAGRALRPRRGIRPGRVLGQVRDRFRARLYQGEATIRLSPAGRARLARADERSGDQSADETATVPDAGGWVTAVVPIESMAHAEADFLRLGPGVEVLAPAELRQRLARAAHGLAALYPPG